MGEIKMKSAPNIRSRSSESGAALVTTVLISLLLLTASIAMLSALGASSRDTSDVLADTKAYYAAESGLQATINVLRNDSTVTYNYAVSHPNLDEKLTYANVNGISQVSVGTEGGYSINIEDPDHTSDSVTFHTTGWFIQPTVTPTPAVVSGDGKTIYIPNATAADRLELSFTDVAATTINFSNYTANPTLGTFQLRKVGNGATISSSISFQVDYQMTSPRVATRSIRATVAPIASASNPVAAITFQTQEYQLVGSEIELCGTTSSPNTGSDKCPTVSFNLSTANTSGVFYGDITAVEPYRLIVTSTGYGPNGARKQLEGIIQKNFFNDLASSSGLSMIGPGASLTFSPGQGNPTYCGVDPGIEAGQTIPQHPTCVINPNEPSGPAIGVSDPTGLQRVLTAAGNTAIVPPPAVITDGPSWQQSPQALNDFISQLRTTAQSNGRYKSTAANLQNTNDGPPYVNVSEWTSGTGITVIDGNADIGPLSGGGILVVTGNLTYSGNFNFRGTIIVTGTNGATRSGAGSGVILGNMVIAPYNPNNLAAGFGAPHFATSGGGSSDLMFSGLSTNFDGTDAITNFMLGVAEK
jgi:Tfp pilus assembly protein PilX